MPARAEIMTSETALVKACSVGRVAPVQAILESRDLPQAELNEGLGTAAYFDHPEIVKTLLMHGAKVTEIAVCGATSSKSIAMLQHYIDHGWDVNSVGSKSPALRMAIANEECVRFLLEHGADPNLPGTQGFTPLGTAISHAPMAVMELLVSYGAIFPIKDDVLFKAIRRKDEAYAATKFVLEHGADPNAPTPRGPPLHLAVHLGQVEVIPCLLEYERTYLCYTMARQRRNWQRRGENWKLSNCWQVRPKP